MTNKTLKDGAHFTEMGDKKQDMESIETISCDFCLHKPCRDTLEDFP